MELANKVERMELCESPENPHSSLTVKNNPLLHHLVLQKIASYLSFKDLTNFRLVSRYWHGACLNKWLDESVISLRISDNIAFRVSDELLPVLLQPNHEDNSHSFALSRPQYSQFRLFSVGIDESWMPQLLDVIGCQITYLELSIVTVGYGRFMAEILCWKTPNLRTLKMKDVIISSEEVRLAMETDLKKFLDKEISVKKDNEGQFEQRNLTTFELELDLVGNTRFGDGPFKWDDFFQLYPNLKHLRVHLHHKTYLELNGMLNGILKWRENNPKKINLKTLDIIGTSDKIDIQRLIQEHYTSADHQDFSRLLDKLRFPLETLCIDLDYHADADINKRILEVHKRSLKKLDVYRCLEGFSYQNPFPFGVDLTTLMELRMTVSAFQGLHHFIRIPNLQIFHLCQGVKRDGHREAIPEFLRKTTNFEAMQGVNFFEKLIEVRFDVPLVKTELLKLQEWMPNVERLMMPVVTSMDVEIMCDGWKRLSQLTVWPSKFCSGDLLIDLKVCMVNMVAFNMPQKLKRLTKLQVLQDPFMLTSTNMANGTFRAYDKVKRES